MSNVTFYVGGNITIANNSNMSLIAPNDSNGVPGVLFNVSGNSVSIQGGAGSALSGIVYAPNATMNLGNGTTTSTMDVVAQSLAVVGGSTLTSYPSASLGTINRSVAKLTQ